MALFSTDDQARLRMLFTLTAVLSFSLACSPPTANNAASPEASPANVAADQLVYPEDAELQTKLAEIAKDADGKVGVFALLIENNRAVSLNADTPIAMQSVVKLPVAMAVLQKVEAGDLHLDAEIEFSKDELVPSGQHSPLRDKNPNGGKILLRELLKLAVSESDGTACDVLTRLAGGSQAVQEYVTSLDIGGFMMKYTHKEFAGDFARQHENWLTAEGAVEILQAFYAGQGISPDHRELLLQYLTETETGKNRLKAQLPEGTVVAHKTGSGSTVDGVTSATNDIGLITLPEGGHVAIAVLVGDSRADLATREAVIARISKAVWETWAKK